MITVAQTFKSMLNMVYTNPQKTEELVKYKSIDEVSFLKRSFKRVEGVTSKHCAFLCPADIDSRLEMLNWTRVGSEVDPRVIEADVVSEVFKELAMHGKETFELWAPRVEKTALDCGVKGFHNFGLFAYHENVLRNIPLKYKKCDVIFTEGDKYVMSKSPL